MKRLRTIYALIAFALALTACSSYRVGPDQISVRVTDEIMSDEKKGYAIERYRVDAYLTQYLGELATDYRIRNSINIETTITQLHLGWGRDSLSVDTVVTENGKELTRFSSSRSTGKSRAVKRLTATIAKDIIKRVKRL